MKKSPAKKSGFTLIEIVIVLAIAALIMVIVFVAVQGAQRSRRDTTSRSNAAATLAAIEQYASNNSGSLPSQDAAGVTAMTNYVANIKPEPGQNAGTAPTTAPVSGTVIWAVNNTCSATAGALTAKTGSSAVRYWSESSAGYICLNN